jgi:hypothetical protein
MITFVNVRTSYIHHQPDRPCASARGHTINHPNANNSARPDATSNRYTV